MVCRVDILNPGSHLAVRIGDCLVLTTVNAFFTNQSTGRILDYVYAIPELNNVGRVFVRLHYTVIVFNLFTRSHINLKYFEQSKQIELQTSQLTVLRPEFFHLQAVQKINAATTFTQCSRVATAKLTFSNKSASVQSKRNTALLLFRAVFRPIRCSVNVVLR